MSYGVEVIQGGPTRPGASLKSDPGAVTAAAIGTSVCIVGGGPGGLMLGLLLAKRGVDVLVLEAHGTFDRELRGEVLQPSTARLLDQIGLLQYILDQPHLKLTMGELLVRGTPAGSFQFKDIFIDADGRFSVIRKLGGFATEYDYHDFDIIWFVVPPPPH